MLNENFKIVPVMNTANFSSGLNGDSINMKNYHKCTFVCTFGAIAGSIVMQVFSGATDAARTSALALKYAWSSAAIGSAACDVVDDWATVANTGVVVGDSAHDNYMLIIEVSASQMDLANNENWLTIYPNAGTSGICHIVAILEPRYGGNQSATSLT
jgi:hypothetical protein